MLWPLSKSRLAISVGFPALQLPLPSSRVCEPEAQEQNLTGTEALGSYTGAAMKHPASRRAEAETLPGRTHQAQHPAQGATAQRYLLLGTQALTAFFFSCFLCPEECFFPVCTRHCVYYPRSCHHNVFLFFFFN